MSLSPTQQGNTMWGGGASEGALSAWGRLVWGFGKLGSFCGRWLWWGWVVVLQWKWKQEEWVIIVVLPLSWEERMYREQWAGLNIPSFVFVFCFFKFNCSFLSPLPCSHCSSSHLYWFAFPENGIEKESHDLFPWSMLYQKFVILLFLFLTRIPLQAYVKTVLIFS